MKRFMLSMLAIPMVVFASVSNAYSDDILEQRIQVGVGQYTIDYVEPFFTTNVKPAGGYIAWVVNTDDYIAFDLRLGGSGAKTDASGLRLSAGGFSAFFRPTLPAADAFELYALLGLSSIAVDRSAPGLPQQTVARAGFSYGAGFSARIADDFSIGAEWVKYLQDENFADAGLSPIKISVTGITAQLAYHF